MRIGGWSLMQIGADNRRGSIVSQGHVSEGNDKGEGARSAASFAAASTPPARAAVPMSSSIAPVSGAAQPLWREAVPSRNVGLEKLALVRAYRI